MECRQLMLRRCSGTLAICSWWEEHAVERHLRRRLSVGVFLSVTSYEPLEWLRQLSVVRQLGDRDHLELWLEWLPENGDQLDVLIELVAGESVLVHAPFVGMSFSTSWKELWNISVDRGLRACEVAAQLGARVITVHPGVALCVEGREEALCRIVQAYEKLESNFSMIDVAIENMPAHSSVTAEFVAGYPDLLDLIELAPSMKFTLDIGHAIQSDVDYL